MKKETKNILTKLALVAAPFAFAATITTSAVSANADVTGGDWVMTPQDKASIEQANQATAEYEKDNHTTADDDAKAAAIRQKKIDSEFKARVASNERDFDPQSPNYRKRVAKKVTKKKVVKKHERRLFRIKVKINKVYAYKTINLHKAGRKLEKKGTKLYVYGIVKKGHKTYYKIAGGRVITSAHKYVTKIAK